MRVASLVAPVAAALLAPVLAPLPASAQHFYTVTPTYQTSVRRWDSGLGLPVVGYQGFGLMAGVVRPGSWWSPHLWLQRYSQQVLCSTTNPAVRARCDNTGWMLSVGPALRLIDHGPWWGQASADVDLGGQNGQGVNGSAGLHVGVRWGAFVPQVFTRLGRFRGTYYQTLGVAMRFELRS